MSICAGIIISISLQKIDDSPYAQACAQCNYQCLQYLDCTFEKLHTCTSLYFSPFRACP